MTHSVSLSASRDQPILLISDLHLNAQQPKTQKLAERYLQHAKGARALFILGDLFEYWLGDDAIDPALQPIIDALLALGQSGTQLYLMHGNRDFLIGQAFAKQIGATLFDSDEVLCSMNNQDVLLMHGDTLCTDDEGYQQLRSLLRSKPWQQDFLSKTIEQRIEMASQLREKSREAVADKSHDIMDVNTDAVNDAFARYNSPLLIHGHTHRPCDHTGAQRRMVLGDWHNDHAMVGVFDGESFNLQRFD